MVREPEKRMIQRLEDAVFEAKRFKKKAELAISMLKSGQEDAFRSSANAAAKRASMDLTKALASLRRSPYR